VLVDETDGFLGTAEKLAAHHQGLRHRAVSVLVFDVLDRVLLQRRAAGKYHSGGLWSNTCCGHPVPGEASREAAERRLREELGLRIPLGYLTTFSYRTAVSDHLIEHELDHVFVGRTNRAPTPDPAEVAECLWMTWPELERAVEDEPARFTPWLPPLLAAVRQSLRAGPQFHKGGDDLRVEQGP